jgi:hypothetical protein
MRARVVSHLYAISATELWSFDALRIGSMVNE